MCTRLVLLRSWSPSLPISRQILCSCVKRAPSRFIAPYSTTAGTATSIATTTEVPAVDDGGGDAQLTDKNVEQTNKRRRRNRGSKVTEVATYNIPTPKGEKKDTSSPLPSGPCSPAYVEAVWYDWWEKQGFFKPEYGRGDINEPCPEGKFVICLPPPNVTGDLHLGHALTNSITDAITRWHRMNGKMTVWVPGCDHAGVATQVVVEKKLMRERGLSRYHMGRDQFLDTVWEWTQDKSKQITSQCRRMGLSVDWERAFFTLDDKLHKAVNECFVRLHDNGTIYRGNRLVHWSCALKSAISNIEVDNKVLTRRTMLQVPNYKERVEFGVMTSFAYHVEGTGEEVVVATTRIETMLGDTAIAVHPQDSRYKHLVGKYCRHPFCDRKLPIVADNMVEPSLGTGAVKVTPAHSYTDYDCGRRNNLPFVEMMDEDGRITDVCPQFKGMKRFDARKAVIEALKGRGLYRGEKEHEMVVPICSRSKDIVEPLIKPQWWFNCHDMAEAATEAVLSGEVKLIPDIHNKKFYNWLEDCRDWCISRQLWWGHRVPAYYVTFTDPALPHGEETDNEYWVSGRNEQEALDKAAKKFNVSKDKIILRQDDDVLDTWFSSGLLPFSIFGWPDETQDLKAFFPHSLLVTGHDILYFWVARMMFFSQTLMGQVPFSEVHLHALIRDVHGRKMSKSLGNVIDPLDVMEGITLEDLHQRLYTGNLDPNEIDRAIKGQKADYPKGIPAIGADAMRFALCSRKHDNDINLDMNIVIDYRNLCNKIWNSFKFSVNVFGPDFIPAPTTQLCGGEGVIERWILSRLALAVDQCNTGFREYRLSCSTLTLREFWILDFCDVFLEYSKPIVYGNDEESKAVTLNVLYTCLETALRLTSPFMPFLAEELWQRLPKREGETAPSICVARYPTDISLRDHDLERELGTMDYTRLKEFQINKSI